MSPQETRWSVRGASGPYRISPNLMAVVPTQRHVVLTYGTDGTDVVGLVLTLGSVLCLVGIGALGLWRRRATRQPVLAL